MNWNRPYLAALLPFAFTLVACDDLGKCSDPNQGRNPVLVGGQVMYAGQAIVVKACASCHSSAAKGKARQGAPAGLDFDIAPVESSGTMTDAKGNLVAVTDPGAIANLRKHQRKVFEQRGEIWEQIQDGLMPPEGVGKDFRAVSAGDAFTYGGDGCTRGEKLNPITSSSTRDVLKQWLACGTPIVETNSDKLSTPVGGTVGDQFPACGAVGGGGASFEAVYSTIFMPSCVTGCHQPKGLEPEPDLSTPELAYKSLLGADGKGAPQDCKDNPDPYVTPMDPNKSYLYAKVGGGAKDEAGALKKFCGDKMPIGTPLPKASLDLLRQWIEAGAPGPGAAGADAGVGDGGM